MQEIDSICYQNFKYKTALLSIQKDHKLNEEASEQLSTGETILRQKNLINQIIN